MNAKRLAEAITSVTQVTTTCARLDTKSGVYLNSPADDDLAKAI